jgi:hypothetical protein
MTAAETIAASSSKIVSALLSGQGGGWAEHSHPHEQSSGSKQRFGPFHDFVFHN